MKLSKSHGNLEGKIRIIPLHVILLIDVVDAKENKVKDEYKGISHYVG